MLNSYTRGNITAALICFVFFGSAVADDFDTLAQNLVKIRAQVEELQNQIDMDKQDHKNELSSLSLQITDLEVEKRRKSLVVEQLSQKAEALQENSSEAIHGSDVIKPLLLDTLKKLKQHVVNGLPFKTGERLTTFDELEKQLNLGVTDNRKVAIKIWALIEDEVRLAKENGLYQQTIVLESENRLADVAKIGMVYLYFKTRDDQVGMASQQPGQWQFKTINDPIEQQQVNHLFDALKKQVRQGFFELPNPSRS